MLYITYTGLTEKNGAVWKINKKCISHPTRKQCTQTGAGTILVSQALPTVCISFLLRGRGSSFQDGVAVGEGFLCVPS
jgi:hypothetical protein